ncbi:hypothetical protein [Roseimicrobium sp. ORNL1]|uniref:hypothetical protein n=1 Tax=Roseimicrobium sp. ORNL1 TaxID=2711231 RepID=UPI0013E1068B|nr:hypothetical protein [Roseimicrobium sp. ORNL1]QIF02440.1 hypothetical protein G5S37_13200 [Roseimicrobium sp. ORNL1]
MDQPPIESESQAYYQAPQSVTPPFAHYQAGLQARRSGVNPAIWAVGGALGVLLLLAAGYYVMNYTRDEFRTLNRFPVEEFMADYERVLGSRFKANVVVDAELGGTMSEGRLYSFREESTQKNLAVVVPPDQNQMMFVKGQTYTAELEVGKGGIIYARRFQKK